MGGGRIPGRQLTGPLRLDRLDLLDRSTGGGFTLE